MILKRIRRKIHKLTHPVVAEVWMLHRIVEKRSSTPRERTLEITPDHMRQRIEQHLRQGGRFISLDELVSNIQAIKHSKIQTFKHSRIHNVVITFDEGCRETLSHVVPLFQEHNIPFTLFVATDFVGGAHPIEWYDRQPDMMDWDELSRLSRNPICTIGAHTVSHLHLCQLSPEKARQEIEQSRIILMEKLHRDIDHFSYPFGERNAEVIDYVRQAGFTSAFEAWGGPVRTGANPYDLPRIPIIQ